MTKFQQRIFFKFGSNLRDKSIFFPRKNYNNLSPVFQWLWHASTYNLRHFFMKGNWKLMFNLKFLKLKVTQDYEAFLVVHLSLLRVIVIKTGKKSCIPKSPPISAPAISAFQLSIPFFMRAVSLALLLACDSISPWPITPPSLMESWLQETREASMELRP